MNGRQAGTLMTIRPPETYLDDKKVMRTHLVRKDDTFSHNAGGSHAGHDLPISS